MAATPITTMTIPKARPDLNSEDIDIGRGTSAEAEAASKWMNGEKGRVDRCCCRNGGQRIRKR